MAKYHIVDLFGKEPARFAGDVFDTKEDAEEALDSYRMDRETEDELAEFESNPADRLDYLMNAYDDDDDYSVEEIVDE